MLVFVAPAVIQVMQTGKAIVPMTFEPASLPIDSELVSAHALAAFLDYGNATL
jgi:hypothetical protein